jgi:hypothetical protein
MPATYAVGVNFSETAPGIYPFFLRALFFRELIVLEITSIASTWLYSKIVLFI